MINPDLKKIEALFLNRVENLKWYYFQFDLGKDKLFMKLQLDDYRIASKITPQYLLNNIEEKDQRYIYCGEKINESEGSALLMALLNYLDKNRSLVESVSRRIFDSNSVANNSDYDKGRLGRLNKKESARRERKFRKVEKEKHPLRKDSDSRLVLAEGDSWFQFPAGYYSLFGPVGYATKDILRNLNENEHIHVKSIAAAGDWFANILYTQQYIEELPKYYPDAFLISGGGNDMVGGNRMAQMVTHDISCAAISKDAKYEELIAKRKNAVDFKEDSYNNGIKFINEEFFQFINLVFIQYFLLFKNLSLHDDYKEMICITQGYDYVHPGLSHNPKNIFRRLYEKAVQNGAWISIPLSHRKIHTPQIQYDIVYVMIHEFNEMLIQLAKYFPNVYHIDCRGVAPNISDWIDELHLKKSKFKLIAETYSKVINNPCDFRNNKVITVVPNQSFNHNTKVDQI